MCSEQLRKGAQFFWKCKTDQSKMGPPGWLPERTENPGTFGRTNVVQKPMPFNAFKRLKTEQHQAGCHFRRKKNKNQDEQVTVFIGVKQLVGEDLKTVRGKRLPICVPKSASYAVILEKAKEKYKAFDRKFDSENKYVLLYEDGSQAQFMPG